MEQITRVPHYPQTKLHVPSLWLPPYLLVVLVLTGGFAIAILGIGMLGKEVTPPDPLAIVADVLAGNSKSDLQARGFLCSSIDHNDTDSTGEWCTFNPPTGMFSKIAVMFVNGEGCNGFLQMRQDTLTVGDLVKLWGRPRIYQHGFWGQLEWTDNGVTVWTDYQGYYSLFLPVRSIVFKDAGDFEP